MFSSLLFSSNQVESIGLHTAPVLADHILACSLRVRGVREEHALVTSCLLVFANTTWLQYQSAQLVEFESGSSCSLRPGPYLDFRRCFTLWLKVCCEVVRRCSCRYVSVRPGAYISVCYGPVDMLETACADIFDGRFGRTVRHRERRQLHLESFVSARDRPLGPGFRVHGRSWRSFGAVKINTAYVQL